jgi:phage protein D
MSAAAPIPLFDDTQPLYAPDFRLTLNGKVAAEPRRDVLSVTYRDNVNEVDSFELSVNNWDAERGRPKYDPPSAPEYARVFAPGTEVVLELGYVDELRVMTRGVVTAVDASWSEGGAASLTVRGLNILHSLRRIEHTKSWQDTTDSAIAKELGAQPLSDTKPGLGIAVRTNPRNEETHPFVQMANQHDIVFLLERARTNDYEVVLHEPDATSKKPYITFGPSDVTTPVYRLEWGKSLVAFRYALDVSEQVGTMVVRGWNRRTNAELVGTAHWRDVITDADEVRRMDLLRAGFEKRTHVEVDRPLRTPAEAKALALDLLRRRLKDMLQATGTTPGLPDLRAGRKVEIVGFEQRTRRDRPTGLPNLVEGEYFVTETTHTLGAGGYRTEFRARREGKARPDGSAQ